MSWTRNRVLFLSGMFVTYVGTSLFNFIVTWWLMKETGSTAVLGLVNTIIIIPSIIINIVIGGYIDYRNKKYLMIFCDICSGVFSLIGWLLLKNFFRLEVVIILTLILSLTNILFKISSKSIIPKLFDKEKILDINSNYTLFTQMAKVSAPLLGAILIIIISPRTFLLINGITFFFSAFSEFFLHSQETKWILNQNLETKKTQMFEGFKYIFQDKKLFYALIIAALSNFFFAGYNILVPYLSIEIMKSDFTYSMAMALEAFGTLLAPLLLKINKLKKINKLLTFDIYLIGCAGILMLAIPNNLFLGTSILFCNILLTIYNLNFFTYLQINVPDNILSRIIGIVFATASISMPLGNIVFGLIGDYLGQWCLLELAVLFALCLVVLKYAFRKILKIRHVNFEFQDEKIS